MPDLPLLRRTLRRTLPRLALGIHALVLLTLTVEPMTFPAAVGCAGSTLLTTLIVAAESRLVETNDEADDLCRVVGELRAELTESHTDPVTGLPLRRIAQRRLTAAQDAGQAVTVALIDVDDMHGVNEAHGHRGGDAYLAAIAWLLVDSAGGTDTAGGTGPADTVARLGGDEFIVISTRAPHTVAAALAALLSTVVPVGDRTVPVRFSAGVHRADGTGHGDPHAALGYADLAMYTAKWRGGGVQVYDAARDGTSPASAARPGPRPRDRSSARPAGPVTPTPTPTQPMPPVAPDAGPAGRHARRATVGSADVPAPHPVAGGRAAGPSCWQCGTPSPPVPGGVRRCPHCGAGLVFDADGWISPAEELRRRRADADARQVAASVRRVAEALPALAASPPPGWSVTAAVPVAGALHSVAVHPPAGSVDATAYLTPDTDRLDHSDTSDSSHGANSSDGTGWTVRVHHRGNRLDFPLYTDGGARAAKFRTAADAFTAAVQALRIEIAAAGRR